jgi:hypothetical protein
MGAFADTSVETAPLDGIALRALQDSWDEWSSCTETIKVRTSQLELSVSSGEGANKIRISGTRMAITRTETHQRQKNGRLTPQKSSKVVWRPRRC